MRRASPTSRRARCEGSTLIEALIALTILAIALLGTFVGVVEAARIAREGQLRQYKTALIEAKVQRLALADKATLPSMVGGLQTVSTSIVTQRVAIGSGPWVIDPSPPDSASIPASGPVPGDLSTGAVFQVKANGEIRPVAGPFTSCADPAIPDGTYCREVLLHSGLFLPGSAPNVQLQGNLNGVNASSFTLWIRISKKGESADMSLVERKVLVL